MHRPSAAAVVSLLLVAACGDGSSDGSTGVGGSASSSSSTGAGGLVCPASGALHGPWVQKVTETSAVIRWDACAAGEVAVTLRPEAGGPARTLGGQQTEAQVTTEYLGFDGVPPDYAGTYWLSEVAATELAPGTCYTYEIANDAERAGRFCTARTVGSSFSFMAIGDTNPAIGRTEELLATVLEDEPDFVVHLGDIQYYSSLIESWSRWFSLMQPMLSAGAFLPCIGNHESENDTEYADYYDRLFADAGFDGNRRWYRFSSGGVWFFSVDTESEFATGTEQGAWLAASLADAQTKPGFRGSVVFMHRPVISVADGGNHPEWRADWEPTFVSRGVVLVLSGHMHGYERFVTENELTYVVSGGGGGVIGDVNENVATYPEDAALRVASASDNHALRIDVGTASIEGAAIDPVGQVLDTFSIPLP